MVPIERDDTLAMLWPDDIGGPPDCELAASYALRGDVDYAAFEEVQKSIGFEVTNAAWETLLANLVQGAMVFIESTDTRAPVAVAVAERRDDGWVELGWVAVAPEHRGRGLGFAVCASLISTLIGAGEKRLFGSTQDHRLAALRNYLTLGFHPVFRKEKVQRWREVCQALEVPFSPNRWGWPDI